MDDSGEAVAVAEDQGRVRTINGAFIASDNRYYVIERKEVMAKEFNIEAEFQAYCKRVRLDLDTCHPTQVIETRRAFFAGIGQLLVFMRDEIGVMDEDAGVAELERMHDQVKAFWTRQAAAGRR